MKAKIPKKYKNISGKVINIDCKPVRQDEEFEAIETQELKNMKREGYLQEFK